MSKNRLKYVGENREPFNNGNVEVGDFVYVEFNGDEVGGVNFRENTEMTDTKLRTAGPHTQTSFFVENDELFQSWRYEQNGNSLNRLESYDPKTKEWDSIIDNASYANGIMHDQIEDVWTDADGEVMTNVVKNHGADCMALFDRDARGNTSLDLITVMNDKPLFNVTPSINESIPKNHIAIDESGNVPNVTESLIESGIIKSEIKDDHKMGRFRVCSFELTDEMEKERAKQFDAKGYKDKSAVKRTEPDLSDADELEL